MSASTTPSADLPAGPLADTARAWLAAGVPAIDVAITAHRGSVPRETGTHMLVSATRTAGTIGGGHLELRAIEAARALLAACPDHGHGHGRVFARELDFPLGPALGQCCGGRVHLRLQPLSATTLALWRATPARFHLQLHGAGHVGRAIVRLLNGLPCTVEWVDERDDAFPTLDELPLASHVQRLCIDTPEAEVAHAPGGACVLVLTHSHALDLRIVDAALKRPDLRWVGLIGSATKRARFEHQLRERGHGDAALARLCCPVGLPGITGKEPEVIAVAVVGELLGLGHAAVDEACTPLG